MPRIITITTLAALVAAATLAAPGYGAVELKLGGLHGLEDSIEFKKKGISVTAEGFLADGTRVDVYQGRNGLAVFNTTSPVTDLLPLGVDARDGAEYLQFTFTAPVSLLGIHFGGVGLFDTFDLMVDGIDLDVPALLGSDYLHQISSRGRVDLSGADVAGSQFQLHAANWDTRDAEDETRLDAWFVKGLKVDAGDKPKDGDKKKDKGDKDDKGRDKDRDDQGKGPDDELDDDDDDDSGPGDDGRGDQEVVPEPGTLVVWSLLGGGFAYWERRRRQRA